MAQLDMAAVRAEFPALSDDFIYLDNAGGSQVLRRVADRVADYLLTTSVQLGASYAASQKAAERVLTARRSVATLINAAYDEEVVMGGATTLLIFQITQALAPTLKPGDEIIVTNTDHEANVGAWMRLAERGAVVKIWEVNRDSLELELEDLDRLLTGRTRWVAMTHASNLLGTVNPVAEVAAKVHAAGGRLCVDGVAYAPHRLVDVQASGADLYVFSFYKVFGPHYAVLWGRRDLLRALPGINHHFIGPDVLPYKLQPGNVNFELSYGCIGISDYLEDMGARLGVAGGGRPAMQAAFDAFEAQEDRIGEMLLAFLRDRPGVKIIGRQRIGNRGRVPTISFTVAGKPSPEIVGAVDPHRIGIRFGDFYARRLAETLELTAGGGVVRVSMAHYNTQEEISRLLTVLDQVI